MIFDREELDAFQRLVETGRNDEIFSRLIEYMNQLEMKIDSNYRIQQEVLHGIRRQLSDALRKI
jgi:hypothetical protein